VHNDLAEPIAETAAQIQFLSDGLGRVQFDHSAASESVGSLRENFASPFPAAGPSRFTDDVAFHASDSSPPESVTRRDLASSVGGVA
jgi:hypothetical protein